MPLSSRARHTVAATVFFAVACSFVVEPLGILSRSVIFAVAFIAVLWATNTHTTVAALIWLSANRAPASYVLFFTLVMFVMLLYRGMGVARTIVETALTFYFFWAFATIGWLHFERKK